MWPWHVKMTTQTCWGCYCCSCWWWGTCWLRLWSPILVKMFKFTFCWYLVETLKLVLDQDSEDVWSRNYFGKQNSTLGSVVPLAMFNSSFTEQNYEHLFLDMAKGIMKANELYAQNSYQLWLITCQGEQIIITWLLAGLHNPQLAPRCIQLNILTIWTLVWYDRVGKNVASKRNVVLSTT